MENKVTWESIEEKYIKNGWEYISVCNDYIEIAKWGDKDKSFYNVLKFEIKYEK